VIQGSKAGFRKGRGTIDNVYILGHLTKSKLKKKGGRMCALLVDFRAAFDKVGTEKMFECMRKREREEKANGLYGRWREGLEPGI
jgi:hypothetical protein